MNVRFHLHCDPDTPHSQRFDTSPFDKRDHDLHMLPPKAYVHIHSDAPLWCKQNIMYTQFLSSIKLTSPLLFDSNTIECGRIYHRMLEAGHLPVDLLPLIKQAAKVAAKRYLHSPSRMLHCWVMAFGDPHLTELVIFWSWIYLSSGTGAGVGQWGCG
jgi:hypothetical protein